MAAMPHASSSEVEPLLSRLWQLLDLATATATGADALDQLEQIALLCDSAALTARAAARLRSAETD
jgi:hypothetical protein